MRRRARLGLCCSYWDSSSCRSLATTTTFRLFPRSRYCCLVETLSGKAAKDTKDF